MSTLTLIILAPLLIILHLKTSQILSIPITQYIFVTFLISFFINYLAIIRRCEITPYLPNHGNDKKLKMLCVCFYVAILLCIYVGWNGSGGIIFAIVWESLRGSKMGIYKYFFLSVIIGSIILENNYTFSKIYEFIPGIIFGFINT